MRHVVTVGLAALVTFGLFWVMQALIGVAGEADESPRGKVIEFVRLKKESVAEAKKRRLPQKQKPEEEPPPPPLDLAKSARPDQQVGEIVPVFDGSLDLAGGPNVGAIASDTEEIPLVRVNAIYPERARQRGIEGWVDVTFTIAATGAVKDPVVTANHPSRIFDRAALRAIRKWKYNPKVEDGVAVERPGVKVRLRFALPK
jgi:protein TonB